MARAIALGIVVVSLTLASPIAWEHHYGVFLPVFAFMAGVLRRATPKSSRARDLLRICK